MQLYVKIAVHLHNTIVRLNFILIHCHFPAGSQLLQLQTEIGHLNDPCNPVQVRLVECERGERITYYIPYICAPFIGAFSPHAGDRVPKASL